MKTTIQQIAYLLISGALLSSCSTYTRFNSSCVNMVTAEKFLIGQTKEMAAQVITEKPVNATGTTWTYHYFESHKEKRFEPGLTVTTLQYNPYYNAYRTVTEQITPDRIYEVDVTNKHDGVICFENGHITGVTWKGSYPDMGAYDIRAKKSELFLYAKEDNLRAYKQFLNKNPSMNTHEELVYAVVEAAKHCSLGILKFLVEEKNVSLDEVCTTWARGENYDYVAITTCARKILAEKQSPAISKWLEELSARTSASR